MTFHLLFSKQSVFGMASQADRGQKVAVGYQTFIAVLCPLVTVIVLLRLLSRHISDARFWWDDAFIVVATVSTHLAQTSKSNH